MKYENESRLNYCIVCRDEKKFSFVKSLHSYFCHECGSSYLDDDLLKKDAILKECLAKEAMKQAIEEFESKDLLENRQTFCDDCLYSCGWDYKTLLHASLKCNECKKLNVKPEESFNEKEIPQTLDDIANPLHYRAMNGMEAIDVIEAFGLDFLSGNVIKYVIRAGRKGAALPDLHKARWYLNRFISKLEERDNKEKKQYI